MELFIIDRIRCIIQSMISLKKDEEIKTKQKLKKDIQACNLYCVNVKEEKKEESQFDLYQRLLTGISQRYYNQYYTTEDSRMTFSLYPIKSILNI